MLSDSLDDFIVSSAEPDAGLPALLDEFESELNYYATKEWGYSPQIFPLLRKAVRGYVAGKFSRDVLEAVRDRTVICYISEKDSELELVDDLRSYLRSKPSNDLRAIIAQMLSSKSVTALRPAHSLRSPLPVQHTHQVSTAVKVSSQTATTATGRILRLVK